MTALDFESLRFSTHDVPTGDRVPLWREVYGQTVLRLDIEPLPDIPFYADLKLTAFPGLRLISGAICGTRDTRTRALLDDGNDDLGLAINVAGTSIVSQIQREVTLGKGDAVLMTCSDVGSFVRPTLGKMIGLRIPRSALAALVPNVDDILIRPIQRNVEALGLLINYIGILEERQALATVAVRQAILAHVYDLVALTVGATRDAAEVAKQRGLRVARLRAVKTDIMRNITQENLSIDSVALRQGLSRSYVTQLFAADGTTFTDFVLDGRLAGAYRMLTNWRYADRKISTIAHESGIGDLSYFNRAFRRRYGLTPSDARKRAWEDTGDTRK